uniref:Uncharacterized protein n=2 Tax=Cacopsylla melanoneura TaxID=428564 RepID=A0A8D8XSI6_9HEMI
MTDQANHFLKMTKETIADTINKTENINQNEKIMFSMVMKNTIGIFQSIEAQRKSRIIDICKENKIPHIVVPLETLRSDLTELDEKISREGYTLSLKTEDITAYYSAEIATCMFSPSKIAIKIQIPIIKKNKKYSISKLIPIPFAWKDVTCIAQQEKEELWISSEYNTQVSKINTEDCKKGLCFMRRVRTQIPSEATCINLIIKRKNHKLMELCQMKCYHTTKTTVTQIKEDHLIITHPSNDTEILCSENKKIITENITYGALEVWLPCNCQIWDKKTIIVENTFPCDSRVTDYLNISHIIPQQWTKWATMPEKINLILPTTENITNFISENWTLTNPHFQIQKQIVNLPFSMQQMMTSNGHIIAIIITSTTSSIFVLICITLYLRKLSCIKHKNPQKPRSTIIQIKTEPDNDVTGKQNRTMRSIQDMEMEHIMKLQ